MKHSAALLTILLAALAIPRCGDEGEVLSAAAVTVTLEAHARTVELSQLPSEIIAGAPYARLSDVAAAAFPQEDLTALQADFFDDPGISPASKDNCQDLLPAAGELLERGFIQLESRNLLWEELLQYPGCMSWRDVAIIALSRR